MEERFELIANAVIEQNGFRPAFPGAQHIAIREAAAGHQGMEIAEADTSADQIAHMHVNGVKSGAVECRRHFHMGVDALLAQHRHFWTCAGGDIRRGDIFGDIKAERYIEARIGIVRFCVVLLVGTFRVIAQALHLPGGFCPPHTQRGAAFAEYRVACGGKRETIPLNGLAKIMNAVG